MTDAATSTTAVIAAAGSGERLGAGGPKALVPVAGRPMIAWSVDAFREAGVAAIVVAAPPGRERELAAACEPDRALRTVSGGETRSQSVRNALEAVETELVAIHDAARPLLTAEVARGVIETLAAEPDAAGAIAACPVTDTIKTAADADPPGRVTPELPHRVIEASLAVERTVDRERLWAAQTPQVFRVNALREALAADPDAAERATDEAMLVETAGGTVLIHPAPAGNIKVTTQVDLLVAEQLLR